MLKSWLLKNTAGNKNPSIENVENIREERVQEVPVPTKIFASSSNGDQRPTKNSHPHIHHKRMHCSNQPYSINGSPLTSKIEWLCVDVDGYKIVNVYKPPPTRLQILDILVFPHPCLYAGDFNCRHADWGYNDNSPDVSAWLAGQLLIVLPSYIMPRKLPVFIPPAGALAPIQI